MQAPPAWMGRLSALLGGGRRVLAQRVQHAAELLMSALVSRSPRRWVLPCSPDPAAGSLASKRTPWNPTGLGRIPGPL